MENALVHTPRLLSILILFAALAFTTSVSMAQDLWGFQKTPQVFQVNPYSDSYASPLTSDLMLTWKARLGGDGGDVGWSIAVDGSGNVYVAGTSNATWGTPIRAYSAENDAFVAKLDSGGALVWNTFLGGSAGDVGNGIAVDATGNVYAVGLSNAAWGTPVRAYTEGIADAFAAKLNSDGALLWNTFLGGSGYDYGSGIALDATGRVYVSGFSHAAWGTPVRPYTPDAGELPGDGFVAKLGTNGALAWNTFLGGDHSDYGYGIAVADDVYLAGISEAAWGTPINPFGGDSDAFVAKLDTNGALLWNSFFGHSATPGALGAGTTIAVDGSKNLYLGGTGFGGIGEFDAFAAKFNPGGGLLWHTWLGGDEDDEAYGIAVDANENVYLGGTSRAAWGNPVRAYSSLYLDVFAAKLDPDGTLIGNTFLGGDGDFEYGGAIAVDGNANVYVTEWGGDAFAAKIPDIITCAKPGFPVLIKPGDTKKAKGPNVRLKWRDTVCATTYRVTVREGSKKGPRVFKEGGLTETKTRTTPLTTGVTYFWRVEAFNNLGKTKSLGWHSFTVK